MTASAVIAPPEKLGRETLEDPPEKPRESYRRLVGDDGQVPAGEPGIVELRRCTTDVHQQVVDRGSYLECVVCHRRWDVADG